MKYIKTFEQFVNEKEDMFVNEWGSSDQGYMNKSIHDDAGKPKTMPSPFDDKLRAAAEDAVDHYWDDWPEYKRDREGLIDKAVKTYLRQYFKKDFEMMVKMFEDVESDLNEGTTPTFKSLMKRAKELRIETISELEDLIGDEFAEAEPHISGADFEIAKKKLRLSESVDEANNLLKQSKLSSAEYQKAKKLKGFNEDNYKWDGESQLYTKVDESMNEAKVMSKSDIDKLVKELVADGRHGDDEAFDIADGILFDEEGLEAGIKKHYKVSDAQGWLANRIA